MFSASFWLLQKRFALQPSTMGPLMAGPSLCYCSMGVAAAAELIAALAFSGDRWRAQLLAKGFLQVRATISRC